MTPARLGASYPTRLSFMRSLIRQLNQEAAQVSRRLWEIDADGFGRAVYSVSLGGRTYSLVAFATPLPPETRTDRVIAEAWDSSYVLFDGVPSAEDLDRLEAQAPRQEAGRFHASELVLCRANKSVRIFDHIVSRLAAGQQPDAALIRDVGYLMRTTAVYGNGKFGIADRALISDRPELALPFRAEMLTVWLIRGFTLDLVDHIAQARSSQAKSSQAARLAPELRRHIGIGNATGLGMAPFLVFHPLLLNNWILARETAIARVCALPRAGPDMQDRFLSLLARARAHVAAWDVEDARQMERILDLRRDLTRLWDGAERLIAGANPWQQLVTAARGLSVEAQELVNALILEPHGDLIDDLALSMGTEREPRLDPRMQAGMLSSLLERHYGWALQVDFTDPRASEQFWYVSAEKLEPRLGHRATEPGSEKETPLDVARQAQALQRVLAETPPDQSVAELAMRWPKLRMITARVQAAPASPYAEIRANLIDEHCLPIDLLRCKLAFFGASRFDPRSERWTRVTLFQGAPGFEDICAPGADDWAFPVLGGALQ
jgi:hypothetical protein